MYSNYNVLTLPIQSNGKYKIGDIFQTNSENWRTKRFNGLEIKNIDYCYGVRLHFDFKQWQCNNPSIRKKHNQTFNVDFF